MDGIRWDRITEDTVVSRIAACVYQVIVTPDTNNEGCILYDARTAVTTDKKLTIHSDKEVTKDIYLVRGMDFHRGIYIAVDGTTTEVVIGYVPLGPGEL